MESDRESQKHLSCVSLSVTRLNPHLAKEWKKGTAQNKHCETLWEAAFVISQIYKKHYTYAYT